MDPDETLRKIRALTAIDGRDLTPAEAEELADLVRGLDEHLTRDGFLPQPWGARTVPYIQPEQYVGPSIDSQNRIIDPLVLRDAAQEQSDLAEEEYGESVMDSVVAQQHNAALAQGRGMGRPGF